MPTNLNAAAFVNRSLFSEVACMSSFSGLKIAKVMQSATVSNLRNPAANLGFPRRPQKTALGVFIGSPSILRVYKLSGFTQVGNPVVRRVAVDVINSQFRPAPMSHHPGQTMPRDVAPQDQKLNTALGVDASGFCANAKFVPVGFPCKRSRLRIVRDDLVQLLLGDGVVSGHEFFFSSKLLWRLRCEWDFRGPRGTPNFYHRWVE